MRRAAVLALLALAGCGSSPTPSRPAMTGPAASCADPSPIAVGSRGPEITGRGRGAQLHGLIMVPRYPIAAGRSTVKIVWRMTGRGPLELAAYDANGRRQRLAWGPEEHGGGNYRRPGDEWGSGYHFRRPGCYRRTVGSAEAWLRVRA